ncbi:HD domain-containing phosphohydrolase [Paenibacillus sp. NEAU-GSW1]|uniref:HD domain-containing phosphohydrolase n=1 Tax=Paenibacillus sp. NEAU-GSW1 TaxID=2682486 RepID=UPI0012E0CDDA|nr:HD domain-containing phosphohydrolase [Paenibacillus sp. NEAU-GSW1]MUT65820.1 HD domain-containing protein [Paenibacillus sp. NEAU-GSW1]
MNETLAPFLKLADAVIITDASHTILNVNETYESITGYKHKDILGKKAGILRTSYTSQSVHADMKAAIHSGKPWSGVFTNRKRSGKLWHSSITITPFEIDGQYYYVGVFRELEQLDQGMYLDDERVSRMQGSLLKVLAISCEIRDPGTEAHLSRVQQLTDLLVDRHNERMNLCYSKAELARIANSSILHDIGKSGIPEGILYKPGSLADYERTIIEMHPIIGLDIVDKIFAELDDELFEKELQTAKNIILHHHEKWDGTGYPHRLKGDAIPLEARIVSVVDVYDALSTKRSYKEIWNIETTLRYLAEQRGKQFDPAVVDSFMSLAEEGLLPNY